MIHCSSPDSRVRVEQEVEHDDRCGPWETVRLVDVASGLAVLSCSHHGCDAEVRFLAGGEVDLMVNDRHGVRRQVRVDLGARCFRLLPDERRYPVSELQHRLGLADPTAAYRPPAPAHPRLARAMSLLSLLGSLTFVAGGLWMTLDSHSAKDRWAGLVGMVFFGACAVSFWSDWRRQKSTPVVE